MESVISQYFQGYCTEVSGRALENGGRTEKRGEIRSLQSSQNRTVLHREVAQL